MDKMPLKEV